MAASLRRRKEEKVTIQEAIESLSGHAILAVESARAICQALSVPFDEKLVLRWSSPEEAYTTFSILTTKEGQGEGVDGLDLSYACCRHLELGRPGYRYTGREFQARANRDALKQHFQITEEEKGAE